MATATLTLGPRDHGRSMTLDEYEAADFEESYRYELGRGVLEVTQIPGNRHNQVVCNLYDPASLYRRDHPRVILRYGGGSESYFRVPEFVSGRHPDFSVVLRPQTGSRNKDPRCALAAEVVSRRSGHRDYVLKREEYLAYGLLEYWIVDFLRRKLTLLVRQGDAWFERVITDESAAIPSVVLPGLTTTLGDLWADLDFYDEDGGDDDEAVNPEG